MEKVVNDNVKKTVKHEVYFSKKEYRTQYITLANSLKLSTGDPVGIVAIKAMELYSKHIEEQRKNNHKKRFWED